MREREIIERQVGHINGEHGEVGHPIVHYLHRPVPRDELIAFFVAADVMLVTPLRDGMNLVAKEYVAAQDPEDPGVLVLSRFAGAARELTSALIVNPYDCVGMAEALDRALNMSLAERKDRYEHLMRAIRAADLNAWRDNFMRDLRSFISQPSAQRAKKVELVEPE